MSEKSKIYIVVTAFTGFLLVVNKDGEEVPTPKTFGVGAELANLPDKQRDAWLKKGYIKEKEANAVFDADLASKQKAVAERMKIVEAKEAEQAKQNAINAEREKIIQGRLDEARQAEEAQAEREKELNKQQAAIAKQLAELEAREAALAEKEATEPAPADDSKADSKTKTK